MHKIVYLDTNIFLHYQPFTQINWLEIVKAESVTIVIPPITIRELNKHKDSHSHAQIKKRAGDTIKTLSGLFDLETTAKLKEEISVIFEDRDPTIDFAAHQLNFNIQDDQLIASILMNRQEAPDEHIVLVTSDLGLALVTKACRQGINKQKMPENLRIADKPDPKEKKIKQLEQQIREINSRIPDLSLVYEDGEQHATFNLPNPTLLGETEIEEKINEIKATFPKKKLEDLQDKSNSLQSTLVRASMMGLIQQKEIDRYNSDVGKFISACTNFIVSNLEFENQKRRTIKLDIALANDGTEPAKDIDIYFDFPDGFQLFKEDELPKPPNPPKPPVEPMTELQLAVNSFNINQMIPSSVLFNRPDTLPIIQQNVSSPKIKRVNSYEVHVHIQNIKHNLQASLDPMFVIFDEFKIANSFGIDYRILAANIPHEVTGKLHIIIKKDNSN